jgi:hypothetical protein
VATKVAAVLGELREPGVELLLRGHVGVDANGRALADLGRILNVSYSFRSAPVCRRTWAADEFPRATAIYCVRWDLSFRSPSDSFPGGPEWGPDSDRNAHLETSQFERLTSPSAPATLWPRPLPLPKGRRLTRRPDP